MRRLETLHELDLISVGPRTTRKPTQFAADQGRSALAGSPATAAQDPPAILGTRLPSGNPPIAHPATLASASLDDDLDPRIVSEVASQKVVKLRS
ncbi:MAG TPA: hypothetical protein VGN69_07675 [Solirubrobacteraceae bacterium]|nr:hypothetical protein [Solirubrobacteraceae bacterium]